MMKGVKNTVAAATAAAVEENMSNLTSASGDHQGSISSSGNRNDNGSTIYPLQYFAPPNQAPEPPANKKKRNQPGNPDPDAEVIALSPTSLLATNRFVCEICSKGFQRDQNLQLHRRGHNLPWKLKQRDKDQVIRKKVYVCPETSCVHHDPSRALGDLTGIKKHFCRKHGEKKWKCEKCSKRYAVQSDWKAHSKTCGTREYRCDCGTLFSRRDSFITHRAFCDALAEESARVNHPHLLTSSQAAAGLLSGGGVSSSAMSHPTINFPNPHTEFISALHGGGPFAMKKEQQTFPSLMRPEIPPWLIGAGPGPPPTIDITPSSSNFSSSTATTPRLDQDQEMFTQHHHQDLMSSTFHGNPIPIQNPNPSLGLNLPPFHHHPPAFSSPHMSATALLQKAARMGATMSKTTSTSSSQAIDIRGPHTTTPHHVSANSGSNNNNFGLNLSSREEMNSGFLSSYGNRAVAAPAGGGLTSHAGGGFAAPPGSGSSFLQEMMTSLSHSGGFDNGSSSSTFEDAYGILEPKKDDDDDGHFHETNLLKTATHHTAEQGGGGGTGNNNNDDGVMTRDFLGLRPLSQSDILSLAGLGNCINNNNNTSSQSHDHQKNQAEKSWQE